MIPEFLTPGATRRLHRPRRHLLLALACSAAVLLMLPAPAVRAARPVRVYEVTVRGVDAGSVLPEAMRQALVRATGRRDAGSDPALAGLVANPGRYVLSSHAVEGGGTQVVFDGAVMQREIQSAGRGVWDSERPFTMVLLSPPLTGAAADGARRSLEELGEARGLPVSLVPMALTDANGAEVTPDALLQNVQRLGGDAVLIGRADSGASSGQWQWTLVTAFSSATWAGAFDAGVNGAADNLAHAQDTTAPLADSDALVQVSGVNSLADYAAIERLLSELPGVRRAGLQESEGSTATFRVLIRGGAEAVQRALANSSRLMRTGSGDSQLSYQLQP
jgi:hypothetical protein